MPEGIEVKILTECLDQQFSGKIIKKIEILSGRYIKHKLPDNFKEFEKDLPLKIVHIKCKGKFIYIECENDWYIFNTLGMTGIWQMYSDDHTRLSLEFTDKSILYFSDIRNFGTFKFVKGKEGLNKKLKELGLDIFSTKEFTDKNFIEKLDKYPEKTLPEVLMNQKLFSGIGNYIKAEALYHAKLSPHRTVNSLTEKEKKELFKKICYVVYTAYFAGNYYDIVDLTGEKIENLKNEKDFCKKRELSPKELKVKTPIKPYQFEVFHKDKDSLGNKVIKEETKDKRTTHWVPTIQV